MLPARILELKGQLNLLLIQRSLRRVRMFDCPPEVYEPKGWGCVIAMFWRDLERAGLHEDVPCVDSTVEEACIVEPFHQTV